MAYITLVDLRAEGVTDEEYGDVYIQGRITLAQQFIETLTSRFFEKRINYEVLLNGTGHSTLFLPIPPINGTNAITSVVVSDEVLSSDSYKYPLRQMPDDRFNPRIIYIDSIWPKGELNVKIVGSFGFVEVDETTPPIIKDLCKRISVWALPSMTDKSAAREANLVEEWLGDYRYKLGEISSRGGVFGDTRIDNILAMYRKRTVRAI